MPNEWATPGLPYAARIFGIERRCVMSDEKPGWGKTIGVFFLCGCLAIGACIITSAMIVHGMGYSGYSNGGLMAR